MPSQPTLACSIDFEPEVAVTRKNTDTRVTEAAAGLTDLRFRLAATPTGAALDVALDVAATEAALAPGVYFATFDLADLQRVLVPTYVGKFVWLTVTKAGDIAADPQRWLVIEYPGHQP